MSRLLLVDLSSLFVPIYKMSAAEADPDYASKATVARVHEMASGFGGVAICCDSRKSWRKELCPEYKAQRPAQEEPLYHQLRLAKEQLAADGFTVWEAEGFEADDCIGSAVVALDIDGVNRIVVASSDKDLACLAGPNVSIKSLRSGDMMGPDGVFAKFGVRPDQMVDWLCLVGDQSDNVPGVKGIGAKTATDLLQKHGSLFSLYQKLGDSCTVLGLTPALFTRLKEGVGAVEMARKLITLRTDVELPFQDIFKPRVATKRAESKFEEEDMGDAVDSDTGEVKPETSIPLEPGVPGPSLPPAVQSVPSNVVQLPTDDRKTSVALAAVEWKTELEPRSPREVVAYAAKLFAARIFDGYGTPEGIMSTILLGRELDIGMMGSLRGIHLADIKGKKRHMLSADLMAALVLRSPRCKFFEPVELTATHATYRTHRVGSEKPFTMTFKIEEARQAGLIRSGGGWETWPLDMCKARCIARLARTVYPDVCFGLYVSEEFEAA